MKSKQNEIPDYVQASLWFANSKIIDLKKEQRQVITAILNRGVWDAVRWCYQFYGEEAIKAVVTSPQRGCWFPQALQFWLVFFALSLDKGSFNQAIFKL